MANQRNMLQKIKSFVLSHKIVVGIAIVLIVVGIYFIVKGSGNKQVSYVTEAVTMGNITTIVTGTGQVEASDTIKLKSKTSGDITYVAVKSGDFVKKGKLIASVDARDARMALENARISLQKLTDVDPLTLLKEENSLKVSYDSAWNKVSSYITDTTKLLDDMSNIYSKDGYLGYSNYSGLSNSGKDKISLGEDSYYKAKESLDDLVKIYKTLSRSDSNDKIKDLIQKSYESSILVASAAKNTEAAFNYVSDNLDDNNSLSASSARINTTSWLNTSNDYVNSLLSAFNGIDEGEKSLVETKAGGDELDIRSSQLSLQSKLDAYNDCFVYAPFDGIIATLTAKVGESSGTSIGTIITKQKVVTVSLNEVDISSLALGQKATLTFDAINNLKINGEVVEIDSIGTVSSGVVNYNVKIALGEEDERVKAGMSSNVEITTASKQNILTVSSSAVKTKNGVSYVEILGDLNKLNSKEVQIGISDDTLTEIISGLKEGDKVVTKTVLGTITSPSTSSIKNTKNIMGGGGGSAMGKITR